MCLTLLQIVGNWSTSQTTLYFWLLIYCRAHQRPHCTENSYPENISELHKAGICWLIKIQKRGSAGSMNGYFSTLNIGTAFTCESLYKIITTFFPRIVCSWAHQLDVFTHHVQRILLTYPYHYRLQSPIKAPISSMLSCLYTNDVRFSLNRPGLYIIYLPLDSIIDL